MVALEVAEEAVSEAVVWMLLHDGRELSLGLLLQGIA
jgi:hypothetical protein